MRKRNFQFLLAHNIKKEAEILSLSQFDHSSDAKTKYFGGSMQRPPFLTETLNVGHLEFKVSSRLGHLRPNMNYEAIFLGLMLGIWSLKFGLWSC